MNWGGVGEGAVSFHPGLLKDATAERMKLAGDPVGWRGNGVLHLENIEYEQLLPFLDVEDKAFFVTCDEYVTMEDGTGIVHIAPAYGADDNRVCQKYGITLYNPVDLEGKYIEGPWEVRLVTDPELEI